MPGPRVSFACMFKSGTGQGGGGVEEVEGAATPTMSS